MLVMDKGTIQATIFLEKAIFIFKFLFFLFKNKKVLFTNVYFNLEKTTKN
jgi:hypothetical protein